LAGKAVTHGNHKRIARDFETKLPTVTGGISGSHRHETYPNVGRRSDRRVRAVEGSSEHWLRAVYAGSDLFGLVFDVLGQL
jgi:hypothetical protein